RRRWRRGGAPTSTPCPSGRRASWCSRRRKAARVARGRASVGRNPSPRRRRILLLRAVGGAHARRHSDDDDGGADGGPEPRLLPQGPRGVGSGALASRLGSQGRLVIGFELLRRCRFAGRALALFGRLALVRFLGGALLLLLGGALLLFLGGV